MTSKIEYYAVPEQVIAANFLLSASTRNWLTRVLRFVGIGNKNGRAFCNISLFNITN
jgi:hypothetical protein